MQQIESALKASLEDFTISRSERKELKPLLAAAQGDKTEQAKIRQLAFRMATGAMEEVGEITTMDWLESIIKLLYSCLLYTSPSPRDQRGSHMPSSA